MGKPLNIESVIQVGLKTKMKSHIGRIASLAFKQRFIELAENPKSQPEGFWDKALMSFLKREAFINKNENFFELLHRDSWSGKGGEVFSSNCDHRFHDLFLGRQREDFLALQRLWKQADLNRIVEFGCNSGLVLDYLTKNLPGVERADGIEINQNQVDTNLASSNFDPRIRFHCADGGQWLLENGEPNTLFVSNGGVLEYFRRERLDEMVQLISRELRPSIFFSIEPVAPDHDWSRTNESVPFGEELSFSHNYLDLFESNGFEVLHQRATDFESWRMMATIAKTI